MINRNNAIQSDAAYFSRPTAERLADAENLIHTLGLWLLAADADIRSAIDWEEGRPAKRPYIGVLSKRLSAHIERRQVKAAIICQGILERQMMRAGY